MSDHSETVSLMTDRLPTSPRVITRCTEWARDMLQPGRAVILDTETTGLNGFVVELAVLDPATRRPLLDTLVRPPVPVEAEAQQVHGISNAMLEDAPSWSEVLPSLLTVTRSRTLIAYNAAFDAGVIARHTRATGRLLEHLAEAHRWACLMERRAIWDGTGQRTRLGASHRAVGDCRAALELLDLIAAGSAQPPHP